MSKDNTHKKKVKQQEDKNRIKRQRFDEKRSIKIIEASIYEVCCAKYYGIKHRNETIIKARRI